MITSLSTSLPRRATMSAWYILLVLTVSLYFIRQLNDGPYGKDFTAFLTGARVITTGHAPDLYDLTTQAEAQRDVAGPLTFRGGVLAFIYPPYAAALFTPLTLLSPEAAYYVWVALQWLLLLGVLASIWSRYRAWFGAVPVIFTVALFSFVPIYEAFLMGQVSVLILALWWWAFVSWRDERWGQLGVAIALAAFKPQMALFLVVALLVQKRWGSILYALATLALLWGFSILIAGPGILASYINILGVSSSTTGTLGFYPEAMPNLRGLLTLAGASPQLSLWLAMAAWAISLLGTALVWLRTGWSLAARFGITVVLVALFVPHIYVYDVSLLVLAVLCAEMACVERGAALDVRWLLLAFAALFLGMYALVLGRLSYIGVIIAVWFTGLTLLALLLNQARPTTNHEHRID